MYFLQVNGQPKIRGTLNFKKLSIIFWKFAIIYVKMRMLIDLLNAILSHVPNVSSMNTNNPRLGIHVEGRGV